MSTSEITIHAADRLIDYVLTVDYTYQPGTSDHWVPGGSWDQGEPPGVEISSVRCTELIVWCGNHAASAFPHSEAFLRPELTVGRWVLEQHEDEIVEKLLSIQSEAQTCDL